MNSIIDIEWSSITDWESFHDVFKEKMEFPDFYARNMDAWIDCMPAIDDPNASLTRVHVPVGGSLVLRFAGDEDAYSKRCPDQFDSLVKCSAFVNRRALESGRCPLLFLAF